MRFIRLSLLLLSLFLLNACSDEAKKELAPEPVPQAVVEMLPSNQAQLIP